VNNPTDITLPHSVRFAVKWQEWLVYKREIKDSYKSPKSATTKAKQLGQYSEEIACRMIDEAIGNGYKGIHPLRTNGKEEQPTPIYTAPKKQKLSTYKPKEYDPNKGLAFIKDRLKTYHETGVYRIRDYGEIYSNRLKHLIDIPESVHREIKKEVKEEAGLKESDSPSRRRLNMVDSIDVKYETRNRCLKWWLKEQKTKGVKVWEKI